MPFYLPGNQQYDTIYHQNSATLGAVFDSFPKSVAIWWYPTTVTQQRPMFMAQTALTGNPSTGPLITVGTGVDSYARARYYGDSSGDDVNAVSGTTVRANTWNLLMGVFAGSGTTCDSATIYLWNSTDTAVSPVTTSSSKTISAMDTVSIGGIVGTGIEGYPVYCCAWDRANDATDFTSLKGTEPWNVQTGSLVFDLRMSAHTATPEITTLTCTKTSVLFVASNEDGGELTWSATPALPTFGSSAAMPRLLRTSSPAPFGISY